MSVLSTFAKLIGVFLILYISGGSATPTPHFTPGRNSLLVPRVPGQHGCGGAQWLRRECMMARVLQTWRDVCQSVGPNGQIITNEVYGSCPPKTVCTSTFDADQDPTIECEPIVDSPEKKKDLKTGTKAPQVGVSGLATAVTSITPTQFDIPVTVGADMRRASVTAFVLSEDHNFAVKPVNVIVGNLRGKIPRVCEGVKSDETKARECYPNGTYNFKQGDIIDFTWGLTSDLLQWGILPV